MSTFLWFRDNAVIPCRIRGTALVSPLTCYLMRWRSQNHKKLKLDKLCRECSHFELVVNNDGDNNIIRVNDKRYKRYDFPIEIKIRQIEYTKMQKLKHLLGRQYSAGGFPNIHIYDRWFNRSRRRFCSSLCGATVDCTKQLKFFPNTFGCFCPVCLNKFNIDNHQGVSK